MLARALHAVVALMVATRASPAALALERMEPSSGEETGGFNVTIFGSGLPFFALAGASVYVNRDQPCTNITVITPFKSLRCVMPPCVKCDTVDVVVRTGTDGPRPTTSNPLRFTYTPACYNPLAPKLAQRYSAAENCTICQHVVGLAQALAGDVTSHQGIREALRDVCASQLIRDFSPVRSGFCRTDLSPACSVLFNTFAGPLADAMWAGWDAGAMYGALPDLACAAIGRCPRT